MTAIGRSSNERAVLCLLFFFRLFVFLASLDSPTRSCFRGHSTTPLRSVVDDAGVDITVPLPCLAVVFGIASRVRMQDKNNGTGSEAAKAHHVLIDIVHISRHHYNRRLRPQL